MNEVYRRGVVLLLLGIAVVIGGGIIASSFATGGFVLDRAPSSSVQEQLARDRGIEGEIFIPDRAEIDSGARVERHGPYLLVPQGWQGPIDEIRPVASPEPPSDPAYTIAETQRSDLWREATFLPDGYRLASAISPRLNTKVELAYRDESGNPALTVIIARPQAEPIRVQTWGGEGANIFVTTEIDDMPAVLWHGPDGGSGLGVTVRAFDESEGIEYCVQGDRRLSVEDAINTLKGLR